MSRPPGERSGPPLVWSVPRPVSRSWRSVEVSPKLLRQRQLVRPRAARATGRERRRGGGRFEAADLVRWDRDSRR
jgi:hypothetical protein